MMTCEPTPGRDPERDRDARRNTDIPALTVATLVWLGTAALLVATLLAWMVCR